MPRKAPPTHVNIGGPHLTQGRLLVKTGESFRPTKKELTAHPDKFRPLAAVEAESDNKKPIPEAQEVQDVTSKPLDSEGQDEQPDDHGEDEE